MRSFFFFLLNLATIFILAFGNRKFVLRCCSCKHLSLAHSLPSSTVSAIQLEHSISRSAAWQPRPQEPPSLDALLVACSRSSLEFRSATLGVSLGKKVGVIFTWKPRSHIRISNEANSTSFFRAASTMVLTLSTLHLIPIRAQRFWVFRRVGLGCPTRRLSSSCLRTRRLLLLEPGV